MGVPVRSGRLRGRLARAVLADAPRAERLRRRQRCRALTGPVQQSTGETGHRFLPLCALLQCSARIGCAQHPPSCRRSQPMSHAESPLMVEAPTEMSVPDLLVDWAAKEPERVLMELPAGESWTP